MEELIYTLYGSEIRIPVDSKDQFETDYPNAVFVRSEQAENFQTGVTNVGGDEAPITQPPMVSPLESTSSVLPSIDADDFVNTQEEDTFIERTFGKNFFTDFFGDLYRAGAQGFAAGGSVNEAFDVYKKGKDISDEELQAFLDADERIQNAGTSDEMLEYQRLYEEEGGGLWGFLAANFKTRGQVLPQIIVSSIATMASSAFDSEEVLGAAAASAGTGAAAGAIAGPAGAITGAAAGAIGGLVGAMETGLTLSELMREELGDKDFNKENVRALLEDADAMARIKSRSVGRGVAIGAVEALTLGISRGVGANLISKGISPGKTASIIAGVEAVGGSTGEVAGRLAADQEMDVSDILFEGVAELKGVVNVADILNKKEYKLNNEKVTKKEILDFVSNKNTREEDIAGAKIEVTNDNSFNNFIRNKQNDVYLKSLIPTEITDANDRAQLFELEKERNKYKGNDSKTAQNLLSDVNAEIKAITDKYSKKGRKTKAQIEQETQAQKIQAATTERITGETVAFAEEGAKKIGAKTKAAANTQELESILKKDGLKLSKKEKENINRIGGFFDGKTKTIYINKDVAAKTSQINVGAHELLHAIIASAPIKDLNKTVQEFKSQLDSKTINVLENKMKARQYGYNERGELVNADLYAKEYLTNFSDAIASGDIKFNESLFSKLGEFIAKLLRINNFKNIGFDNGKQVYNFMKEYSKNAKEGKLSTEIAALTTDKTAQERLLSIDAVERVNNIYNQTSDKIEAGFNIALEYDGMAENYINKFLNNPNLSKEQKSLIKNNREDIKSNILYTPLPNKKEASKNRNVLGMVQDFRSEKQKYNNVAAYINSIFNKRALGVMNYYFKQSNLKPIETEEGTIRKDVAKKTASTQDVEISQKQEKGINRKIKLDELSKKIFSNPAELINNITEAFEKEIKLEVRKGTLKNFDVEKFVQKYIRKIVVEKFGKIGQKIENNERIAIVPDTYKSIIVSSFDDIIDALPVKDIKKRYSRLFKIKEIGREKTPEGNPIYKIPKPDKKDYVDFFTKGKPTTLIERQKGLAEIFSNYLTSKVVSDYATIENLKDLNSIKELAPKEAVDVIENIVIENEINKIADQVNRYSGERMLQDERLFSIAPIQNKSQILALAKEANNSGFGSDLYIKEAKKYPKVVQKFVEALYEKGIFEGQRIGGIIYEELLLDNIARLGGVTKILKSGAAYDSTAADLQLLINDVKVLIEAKLDVNALFGQTGIQVTFKNNETEINFVKKGKIIEQDKLPNYNLFKSMVTQSLPLLKNIIDDINTIEGTNFNSFPLGTHIAQTTWTTVQASENYKLLTKINKKMSSLLVSEHYNSKGMYYIQIGGKGLYHLGQDIYGLGTTAFDVEFVSPLGFKQSGAAFIKEGFEGKRVRIQFKSEAKIADPKKLKDTPLNLEDKATIEKMEDIIRLHSVADLNKGINDIIEEKTNIASHKTYSAEKAKAVGANKGRFNFYIAPSAEDFVGLLYKFLSKGKLGEMQMAWFKKHLIDPYSKAMYTLNIERMALMNDFRAIKKKLKNVPKQLKKTIPGDQFTYETAVRVYMWARQGMNIPGLSKTDAKNLINTVKNNKDLKNFADQVMAIHKDGYPQPQEFWSNGTMTTDMLNGLNTVRRKDILQNWQSNADVIFSKENLNKMEAAFGFKFREAMENILDRMKTGRNRPYGGNRLANAWLDWVNGSVGVVMFLNMRSALLQTISSVNYINWNDNNILAAGKAFANQKQYWKDFLFIWNSDYLKDRRGGLKLNVSESEIADMADKKGVNGVISFILKNGFIPTRAADSFAISSGGATMYRNRINTYLKQGLDKATAEQKAFLDFRELTEEAQQSSRPDRISMQQSSNLGRIFLAWANTPMQYGRLIKRSTQDFIAGRGDRKTHLSKIIYYTFIQNVIFNALQQGLFALAFDEENDEEEKIKRYSKVGEGMLDSLISGSGVQGKIVIGSKNILKSIVEKSQKSRPNYTDVLWKLFDMTPPIDSKISRLKSAGYVFDYQMDEVKEQGLSLDNPGIMASSQIISALTNIPVDRAIKKANNVQAALSEDAELWQRIALILGWSEWELGMVENETVSVNANPRKLKRRSVQKRKIQTRK